MRRLLPFVIAMAAVVAVPGCSAKRGPVVIERPVYVTRTVYVPIPASLTQAHPIAEPRDDTGREALRVCRARKAELVQCNADMAAIGTVQGTEATP